MHRGLCTATSLIFPLLKKNMNKFLVVLNKVSKTFQVRDLLSNLLDDHYEREALIGKICVTEEVTDYFEYLMEMSSKNLSQVQLRGSLPE